MNDQVVKIELPKLKKYFNTRRIGLAESLNVCIAFVGVIVRQASKEKRTSLVKTLHSMLDIATGEGQ